MSSQKVCPLCGSDKLTQVKHNETVCEPFGGCEEITLTYDTCELCGLDGDFSNQNDELIQQALKRLKSNVVKSILNDFSNEKFNLAGMERILELPQRTLTKWKNGSTQPSAAGVTLLRFMRLFPWLLMVAEQKFDYDVSQRIHIQNAIDKMLPAMQFDNGITPQSNLKVEFHYHDHAPETETQSLSVEGIGNEPYLLVQNY